MDLIGILFFFCAVSSGCASTGIDRGTTAAGGDRANDIRSAWVPLDEACVRRRWRCARTGDHVIVETQAGVFRFPLTETTEDRVTRPLAQADVVVTREGTVLMKKRRIRLIGLHARLGDRVFDRGGPGPGRMKDASRRTRGAPGSSLEELTPDRAVAVHTGAGDRPVIVVDPGHGGKDPGAVSPQGLQEKDVVLDIAERLAELLERRGYVVKMTRSDDEFIPLSQRVLQATEVKADAFISIHANAHSSRRVKGWEVYMVKDLDYDDQTDPVRLLNEDLMLVDVQRTGDPEVKPLIKDLMASARLAGGRRLAACMTEALKRTLGPPSRRPMPSRFFVIRNTVIPAVLIEVGYLTNPDEHDRLRDPDHRQAIARALAQGVRCYDRGADPAPSTGKEETSSP